MPRWPRLSSSLNFKTILQKPVGDGTEASSVFIQTDDEKFSRRKLNFVYIMTCSVFFILWSTQVKVQVLLSVHSAKHHRLHINQPHQTVW